MTRATTQVSGDLPEVIYPAEAGEPMAETPVHTLTIMLLYEALEDFLQPLVDAWRTQRMQETAEDERP